MVAPTRHVPESFDVALQSVSTVHLSQESDVLASKYLLCENFPSKLFLTFSQMKLFAVNRSTGYTELSANLLGHSLSDAVQMCQCSQSNTVFELIQNESAVVCDNAKGGKFLAMELWYHVLLFGRNIVHFVIQFVVR